MVSRVVDNYFNHLQGVINALQKLVKEHDTDCNDILIAALKRVEGCRDSVGRDRLFNDGLYYEGQLINGRLGNGRQG